MADTDQYRSQSQTRVTPPPPRREPGLRTNSAHVQQPHAGSIRNDSSTSQRYDYRGSFYIKTTDAEHSLNLLEHLSEDLANLLNRTDISDCFLKVDGNSSNVHANE